ncbi:MAG: hypothetical protein ACOYM2_06645 [Rectinemataceae bacterium]
MNRIAVVAMIALISAASVVAQPMMQSPQGNPGTQTITKVDGTLAFVNGMIAVKSKDKTYYVGGLQQLFGFADGLKEGATVTVEGYATSVSLAPEYAFMHVTKLTFNKKEYDLSQARGMGMGQGRGHGMMDDKGQGRGMRGGQGPGPCSNGGNFSPMGNRG